MKKFKVTGWVKNTEGKVVRTERVVKALTPRLAEIAANPPELLAEEILYIGGVVELPVAA